MTGKRLATLAGIVVALGVMALAPQAAAQQDPPRDTSATPAPAESATPLALRPSRPLELAQEPPHAGLGWKIVAAMAILGGAALYMRKRSLPKRITDDGLTIVRRASVGIRSELLIVNVEGQRLLIGVTPNSIQSLASLDGDGDPRTESETPVARHLGERFAAILNAADSDGTRGRDQELTPIGRAREDRGSAIDEAALAGQARGLLALRRRG